MKREDFSVGEITKKEISISDGIGLFFSSSSWKENNAPAKKPRDKAPEERCLLEGCLASGFRDFLSGETYFFCSAEHVEMSSLLYTPASKGKTWDLSNPPPLKSPGSVSQGPTFQSHWVIPNYLIAGAYPGHWIESLHTLKIQKLLLAGVSAFVCLQTAEELNSFREYGSLARRLCPSIECSFCPIPDQSIVADVLALRYAEHVIDQMREGHTVYLHCWGGHGRTGTIVALILARVYRLSPEEALELTQKYHDSRVSGRKSPSPQTKAQRKQVIHITEKYYKPEYRI